MVHVQFLQKAAGLKVLCWSETAPCRGCALRASSQAKGHHAVVGPCSHPFSRRFRFAECQLGVNLSGHQSDTSHRIAALRHRAGCRYSIPQAEERRHGCSRWVPTAAVSPAPGRGHVVPCVSTVCEIGVTKLLQPGQGWRPSFNLGHGFDFAYLAVAAVCPGGGQQRRLVRTA
jgi:hypothetical protein